MTIRTKLQPALGRVIRLLLQEFGVATVVQARVESTAADGSAVQTWAAITGSPVNVYLAATTNQERQRLWGQEDRADFTGYAALAVPIVSGNILQPSTGPMAGRSFEVTRDVPDDIGQFIALALVEVSVKS